MAGDGILVRGRNGHFQIDAQFLQPIVIEEGTLLGAFVQYADTYVNDFGTFNQGWNTGGYESGGDSEISLPSGYSVNDVIVFAKPSKQNNIYDLAMRWVDDTTFSFFTHDQRDAFERRSCNVDYVICSVLPEDAPAPHLTGSGEYGLEVRNDFGDVVYDSTRKTFLGEAVLSGRPRIRRYARHATGNVYAIEGLGMNREEDTSSQIVYSTINKDIESNKDLYVMMDCTSMVVSMQSWGTVTHPRGVPCKTHDFWCFIRWDFNDIQFETQDIDEPLDNCVISTTCQERILSSDGTRIPSFQDFEPIRTLLIGRFQ